MPFSGPLGYVSFPGEHLEHLASFPGELLGLLHHVHFVFSDVRVCVPRAGFDGSVMQANR